MLRTFLIIVFIIPTLSLAGSKNPKISNPILNQKTQSYLISVEQRMERDLETQTRCLGCQKKVTSSKKVAVGKTSWNPCDVQLSSKNQRASD